MERGIKCGFGGKWFWLEVFMLIECSKYFEVW